MLVYHNISYCSFITIFHINGHAKCTLIAKPRYQTVHNWQLVHLELASFASTNCVLSFKILQVSNQNLNDIHVFLTARCCKYVESTCKVWRRFYQLCQNMYILTESRHVMYHDAFRLLELQQSIYNVGRKITYL